MMKDAHQHLTPCESLESYDLPKERQEDRIPHASGKYHPLVPRVNVPPGEPRQLKRKANTTTSGNSDDSHQGN